MSLGEDAKNMEGSDDENWSEEEKDYSSMDFVSSIFIVFSM